MCCAVVDTPPPPPRPLELLEREICELSAHMAVGMCRWLQLVAEFDQRAGWAEWGVYSCAHWLSWRCSIGLRAARENVRVANALAGLPLVTEAFAGGELSYSKVRAITRVASAENEEYLVMLARHATGAQLEKIVAGYRGVLAATVQGANDARARRHLYWEYDGDGSLLIQARIPAEEGALVLAAIEHADHAAQSELEWDAEEDDRRCSAEHPWESLPARRADALVALARAELALDGQHHTGPDPVELTVHVDVETLAADEVGDRCEIADGPSIAPETARRLGCDAGLVRIIEKDGQPLTVGRRTRSIPPALRRALSDRDPHCRFPGCTHTRYLHAHHIHHWARGGPTNLTNLIHLCPHHHRLVHEGGFTLRNTVDAGLVFERPDGQPIPDQPPQTKLRGPTLPDQNRQRGIPITPDTCRPLSAGDRLDYGMAVDGLAQEDGLDDPKRQPPPNEADDPTGER
jgi:Domain of unknown function (DUF222)/HNH endonuclease